MDVRTVLPGFLFSVLLACQSFAGGSSLAFPEITFYPKSTIIPEADKQKLTHVYEYLKQNPRARLEIRGYSDAEKNIEEGRRLATERVHNVYTVLLEMGVPEASLVSNVYSAFDHLADHDQSAGLFKRIVEFLPVIEESTKEACYESLHTMLNQVPLNSKMYREYLDAHGSDKVAQLCFKVQIAAHKNRSGNMTFPFIGDNFRVEREVYDDYIRYTVGCYETFCQALESRQILISEGASTDAWIVAYYKGGRLAALSLAGKIIAAK